MATVRIPTPLRKHTNDQAEVSGAGATLREVITDLESNYPGIQDRLLDDDGNLRRFINVFVRDEDVRFLDGLDTSVADSDVVSIVPAVAGGN